MRSTVESVGLQQQQQQRCALFSCSLYLSSSWSTSAVAYAEGWSGGGTTPACRPIVLPRRPPPLPPPSWVTLGQKTYEISPRKKNGLLRVSSFVYLYVCGDIWLFNDTIHCKNAKKIKFDRLHGLLISSFPFFLAVICSWVYHLSLDMETGRFFLVRFQIQLHVGNSNMHYSSQNKKKNKKIEGFELLYESHRKNNLGCSCIL